MFQSVNNAWDILWSAIRALGRYPRMLVPMLVCWAVYAPLVVYLKYRFPWDQFSLLERIGVSFIAILILSFAFSWSAFALLELIKQIETKTPRSQLKAWSVGTFNVLVALPIVVSWATLWLMISVLEAIFRKAKGDEDAEMTARNVAKTLAGFEEFSFTRAFFSTLKRGVRMTAFMMYPAIAWERMGTLRSVKRGFGVMKAHKGVFVAGFALTGFATAMVFFPPALLFAFSAKAEISLPDAVWFWTMIYCAFAWSFCLFLEQMFVAEFYLWHLIWERKVGEAEAAGTPPPRLEDVHRPSVTDNYPDMRRTRLFRKSPKNGQR